MKISYEEAVDKVAKYHARKMIDDYYIGGTQHSVSPVREASVIAIIFSKDWTDVLDDFEPLFKKYFNKRLEEGFKGE